jgi:hypothetical protein
MNYYYSLGNELLKVTGNCAFSLELDLDVESNILGWGTLSGYGMAALPVLGQSFYCQDEG